MRKLGAALSAGFTAALLWAGNMVPVPAHFAAAAQFQDVRLTHILGMTVEDPNAQELGVVKDLVLDVRSSRVAYAIVSSGGFLGIGTRARALPARYLSAATILRGTLSSSQTKAEWEQAPAFTDERLALAHPVAQAGPVQRLASHFSGTPETTAHPRDGLESARELLGKRVLDAQHQKLGAVTDLLVDFQGQKPPVVVFCSRKLLTPELCGAVPLPRLGRSRGQLVLDTDRRQLEQAPWFTPRAWQTVARHQAPVIYRVAAATPG